MEGKSWRSSRVCMQTQWRCEDAIAWMPCSHTCDCTSTVKSQVFVQFSVGMERDWRVKREMLYSWGRILSNNPNNLLGMVQYGVHVRKPEYFADNNATPVAANSTHNANKGVGGIEPLPWLVKDLYSRDWASWDTQIFIFIFFESHTSVESSLY